MPLEAFFLPVASGRLFCLLHRPENETPAKGAVIYVHPFAEEMNKSRRMAALQARAMAAAGYTVLQVDLLGCGDSSGDFGDATWESGIENLVEAGAWLQDRRLRVSARRNLDESLIATGIPFSGRGDSVEWSRIYAAIGPHVAGIRRFGAASLDLAWVAAGRFDGYWESSLQPWDSAAGCLLVREAGGFVTNFRGQSEAICADEVLAGNDALHSRLHKLIASALK